MNRTNNLFAGKIGIVLFATLSGVLTGCVTHVHEPVPAQGYAPPPRVYVEEGGGFQDDYVYFPEYEVYYSSNRRRYVYLEGSSWVARPAPPRVAVSVLYATPSVRMDFHDSPSIHHTTVIRQYPRRWSPSGADHNHGRDDHNDGKSGRNDRDHGRGNSRGDRR